MNVNFRRPGISEVEDLASLHVRCWRESYSGLLDAEFLRTLDPADRAAMWRQVIPDSRMFPEVACIGGEKVGFIIAGPASGAYRHWADGEIHALYLLKIHQGLGIGRQLLQRAARNWSDRGGMSLVAMVFAQNAPARRFYEAQGGVVAGEMDIDLAGRKLAEVAYVFSRRGLDQ